MNKASTENLLCEIKILKQIKHEYVVQLIDFQVILIINNQIFISVIYYFLHKIKWDDNYIYLIMEYCQGGDLSNFIRSRRTIPEKYVRKFIQQIGKLIITIQIKFFNNHYFI